MYKDTVKIHIVGVLLDCHASTNMYIGIRFNMEIYFNLVNGCTVIYSRYTFFLNNCIAFLIMKVIIQCRKLEKYRKRKYSLILYPNILNLSYSLFYKY